jgi:hypothetical protein
MEQVAKSLKDLTDNQLLSEVKLLVAREREATTALILSLAELEERQLHLSQGYPSLLRYCTDVLQLSRAAAFSRIRAARTLRAFPAAVEHLVAGSITLTNLNVLAPHLTVDNHVALLSAAQYQTKEEVERQMSELSPGAVSLVTMHLRVHVETRDKLRRAQDLLRHAVPDANVSEVLDRALTLLIGDLEKKKLAKVKRPRQPARVDPASPRYVPAWMKRAVFDRDGGRCKFVGAAARCPETAALEIHHLNPYARGGRTKLENLELRCKAHNQYEAELAFGSAAPYSNSS